MSGALHPQIKARLTPERWDPQEPLTLLEAALLFPMGPIGLGTLRRARRQGRLAVSEVCNGHYTTIEAVRAMTLPVLVPDLRR